MNIRMRLTAAICGLLLALGAYAGEMGKGDMGMMNMPMMQDHMSQMHEHMKKMKVAKSDKERTRLMQDHMEMMDEHMSMMMKMMDMMGGGSMDAGKAAPSTAPGSRAPSKPAGVSEEEHKAHHPDQ